MIDAGDSWHRIQVTHKLEGLVTNILNDLSTTVIGLEEGKRKFNATFLNHFEPVPGGGTRYVLHACIRLTGIYRVLKPSRKGYVRRRSLRSMQEYVQKPIKAAAEKKDSMA